MRHVTTKHNLCVREEYVHRAWLSSFRFYR